MKFDSLKEKCEYFRSLADIRLMPNSYVMVMIDGRRFSKLIKKRYERPFDDKFIAMMNEVAQYVCSQVQGVKFAYVQSDEVNFVLSDFDTPQTDSFFGYRLCKMQSIIASLATAKFNQLMTLNYIGTSENFNSEHLKGYLSKLPLVQFDCKAWNVPNLNEVYAWMLYRNIDYVRNSKQQTAQTWIPHKDLKGKNTDEQIALLLKRNGVDWHSFDDGKKFGRFVHKVSEQCHNDELEVDYERGVWKVSPAFPLSEDGNKEKFFNLVNLK